MTQFMYMDNIKIAKNNQIIVTFDWWLQHIRKISFWSSYVDFLLHSKKKYRECECTMYQFNPERWLVEIETICQTQSGIALRDIV